MEHWRTHVTHLGPRAAQPPFGPWRTCVTGRPAGFMRWPLCDSNNSMKFLWDLNGVSMRFLWVLTGFLWDLANNNGDLVKFNENIPSSYQPWQLEIPLFNPSFHEKNIQKWGIVHGHGHDFQTSSWWEVYQPSQFFFKKKLKNHLLRWVWGGVGCGVCEYSMEFALHTRLHVVVERFFLKQLRVLGRCSIWSCQAGHAQARDSAGLPWRFHARLH